MDREREREMETVAESVAVYETFFYRERGREKNGAKELESKMNKREGAGRAHATEQ